MLKQASLEIRSLSALKFRELDDTSGIDRKLSEATFTSILLNRA